MDPGNTSPTKMTSYTKNMSEESYNFIYFVTNIMKKEELMIWIFDKVFINLGVPGWLSH